jgi:trehalose-6-phosphatase
MALLEVECPNCHQRIMARFIADVRTTTFRTGPRVTYYNKIIGCYPKSVWRRENLLNIYANEIFLSVCEGDDKDLWIETVMDDYDLPEDIAKEILERVMAKREMVNTSYGLRRKEETLIKTLEIPDQMPSL